MDGSTRASRSSRSQPRTMASSVVPSTCTLARSELTSSMVASTPRSEARRVSSTSSQACSSRPPRLRSPSSALPRAEFERASRARRRFRRPADASGRSIAGAGAGSGSTSGPGTGGRVSIPAVSWTDRFGASRGGAASSPTPGRTSPVARRGGRQVPAASAPAAQQPEQDATEDDEDADGNGDVLPQLINHARHPLTRAQPPPNRARGERTTKAAPWGGLGVETVCRAGGCAFSSPCGR